MILQEAKVALFSCLVSITLWANVHFASYGGQGFFSSFVILEIGQTFPKISQINTRETKKINQIVANLIAKICWKIKIIDGGLLVYVICCFLYFEPGCPLDFLCMWLFYQYQCSIYICLVYCHLYWYMCITKSSCIWSFRSI